MVIPILYFPLPILPNYSIYVVMILWLLWCTVGLYSIYNRIKGGLSAVRCWLNDCERLLVVIRWSTHRIPLRQQGLSCEGFIFVVSSKPYIQHTAYSSCCFYLYYLLLCICCCVGFITIATLMAVAVIGYCNNQLCCFFNHCCCCCCRFCCCLFHSCFYYFKSIVTVTVVG